MADTVVSKATAERRVGSNTFGHTNLRKGYCMNKLEIGDEIDVRLLRDIPKQYGMKAVRVGTVTKAMYTPDGTFWLYHPVNIIMELIEDAKEGVDFEFISEKPELPKPCVCVGHGIWK